MRKIELVIHPVRFRILQILAGYQLTTQEIAEQLPDIPKSSIYRHLTLLRKGEMIAVTEKRLVNGIQEKVYALQQSARLGAADMADITADDHIRYFTTYVMTLLQGYADYVGIATEDGTVLDMVADRTGYSEVVFQATRDELDGFQIAVNQALLPLLQNEPGNGRSAHKIAIVSHPHKTIS